MKESAAPFRYNVIHTHATKYDDQIRWPTLISQPEGEAMVRAALNLFGKWTLTTAQACAVLDISASSYERWKQGRIGPLGADLKARLSNLLGIHAALRLIFTDAERGYTWIKAANAAFHSQSALDVMLGGYLTDIMRVRHYLDAQRGSW
jgi:Protein of unknown function (DUF2384)